jgi:hypothetical protein
MQFNSRLPDASLRLNRGSRLVTRKLADVALRGEAAFESFLHAVMAWTVTEVLAGCAEYGEAIRPRAAEPGKAENGHDAADHRRFHQTSAAREIRAGATMLRRIAGRKIMMPRTLDDCAPDDGIFHHRIECAARTAERCP